MIVLAPDFMTKICKKAAQHFHCAESKVFTIEKSVALWSANIYIKNNKDLKSYGSAASVYAREVTYEDNQQSRGNRMTYNYFTVVCSLKS